VEITVEQFDINRLCTELDKLGWRTQNPARSPRGIVYGKQGRIAVSFWLSVCVDQLYLHHVYPRRAGEYIPLPSTYRELAAKVDAMSGAREQYYDELFGTR
jgi:hypothetical protein